MFSVLMSVYHREQPDALEAALESLVRQTRPAAEIVLVKDGPLSPGLDRVIETYSDRLPMKVHALPHNQGLAAALNAGLKVATSPWIMRFDSDDICLPNRIEIQTKMALSSNEELMGGQIREFEYDPRKPQQARYVPCGHDEILRFGIRRNPFNHMTVCFRREVVLQAGGYPAIPMMEDYGLWMSLLARGVRSVNSPEVLVLARVGNGMIARRGSMKYVRSEWAMQHHLIRLGLKSRWSACYDGARRSAVFFSPTWVRAIAYSRFLRQAVKHGL